MSSIDAHDLVRKSKVLYGVSMPNNLTINLIKRLLMVELVLGKKINWGPQVFRKCITYVIIFSKFSFCNNNYVRNREFHFFPLLKTRTIWERARNP